jgi:hypothetical protein
MLSKFALIFVNRILRLKETTKSIIDDFFKDFPKHC